MTYPARSLQLVGAAVVATAEENAMRDLILSGAMSPHRAIAILNNLDVEKPWYRKLDYIQGIAAVSALFPKEMQRKTYVAGRLMRSVVWSATANDKLAWYWNGIIVRRSMPRPNARTMAQCKHITVFYSCSLYCHSISKYLIMLYATIFQA